MHSGDGFSLLLILPVSTDFHVDRGDGIIQIVTVFPGYGSAVVWLGTVHIHGLHHGIGPAHIRVTADQSRALLTEGLKSGSIAGVHIDRTAACAHQAANGFAEQVAVRVASVNKDAALRDAADQAAGGIRMKTRNLSGIISVSVHNGGSRAVGDVNSAVFDIAIVVFPVAGAAVNRSDQAAGGFALDPDIMVVFPFDIGSRQVHLAMLDFCAVGHRAHQRAGTSVLGLHLSASQGNILYRLAISERGK